jgi:thiol-disulfide isomerase/thioredoxin
MLRLFLFVLLTCAFISSAEVIVLGNANFTSAIQEHPFILVMFYAPWCSFSKQFLPEYEKIEEDLRDVGIPLAKVNCVEEKDLYWQHNIEGFPTLKVGPISKLRILVSCALSSFLLFL